MSKLRERKKQEGKAKRSISALISVDEFSAKKFLQDLRDKGYKLIELDLGKANLSSVKWQLLQGSLFAQKKVYVFYGLTEKSVQRVNKELLNLLRELERAGVKVILWLVSERWILRPEILGKDLYAYIQSDEVTKIFLETPRKRKSELEKTLKLAQELNLNLSYDLLTEIVERFNGDMDLIYTFLKKLASSGITSEEELRDILSSENPDFEINNLTLLDAFSHKEWDRVLRGIKKLRETREDVTPFYYLLASQLILALETLNGLRRGRKIKEVASELGAHHYRIMKVAEILEVNEKREEREDHNKWTEDQLIDLIIKLTWGEVNAKRGRKSYPDPLEEVTLWLLRESPYINS